MALRPLNSVAGFSVGETPSTVILGNADVTANNFSLSGKSNLNAIGNVYISGGANGQVIKTDGLGNLSFVTIDAWKIQNGNSSVQVLGNSNVTVSVSGNANIATFTSSGFDVSGYINAGNITANGNLSANNYLVTPGSTELIIAPGSQVTRMYSNVNPFTDLGYSLGNSLARWNNLFLNTANVTGNISAGGLLTNNLYYANGQPWDLQEAAGSNTQIQYNDGNNNFGASANFTFNNSTNVLNLNGNAQFNNANLGNLATANFVNVASNIVTNNLSVNNNISGNTANFTGNISALNFVGNVTGNITAPGANTYILFNDANITNAVANFTYDKTYNLGGGKLNVGWGVNGFIITDDFYTARANINGNLAVGNISATGNLSVTNISANGNITITSAGGDITGVDNISANSANFSGNVLSNNVTVNVNISGNTANFTGNITAVNANLGNLITANHVNAANDINALAGNINANGSINANNFLTSANATVTGQVQAGSVLTANITAPTGSITISAAGVNQNILLVPSGTGIIDASSHNIVQVAAPINPNDAATKEYVDSVAQGLSVHPATRVTSITNLNATYANGGSTLTTTTISGGKTIQFSANHGLSLGDEIFWENTFNGIISYNGYFVFSIPALNQITIKDGFFGAEVTTLTNGTGLSQPAKANSGVGATLTNAGANAAIVIDGISLSSTNRVLIQGQTNAVENGVYVVTTVGNGSTAWVLTRASDANTYDPKSVTGLGAGDYFFVEQGVNYAGSSYVLSIPPGEILFGYTDIDFNQFGSSGTYSAGNGISITGTIISANTDGITTDIVGGNIVVKTGATLTTPNIGDATFSSLTWNTLSNGNVTANNLSIGNIANITGNLNVSQNIQSNGAISSNANVSALNFTTAGNVIAANLTANATVSAVNSNISGTTITNALSVNNAITGNTANFSGNIIVNNATVNLQLSGNTANFTGNLTVLNANLGNLAIANFINVSSNLNVTDTANVGNLRTNNLLYANGQPWDLQEAAGSNTQIQYNNNNNFGASANFTFNNSTNVLNLNGDANIANAVVLGNTRTNWATVITTGITANQTIASFSVTGITGIEYLVKGIDASGKYSVATVQAVTDGTSVDFSVFGTVTLGGSTGVLAVNVVGGFVRLQVTPSSSNSTVWTTQYRLI